MTTPPLVMVTLDPAWRELPGWPLWADVSAELPELTKNDMLLRSVWGALWCGLGTQPTGVKVRAAVLAAAVSVATGPAKAAMTEALLLAMATETGAP